VVNDSIKEAKRQGRKISLDDPNERIIDLLTDDCPSPEDIAEASDMHQLIWNALQQLPPEQRAVVVQRHFLDMKEAEMVESLKRPASTIKWWLHTARERLKTILSIHKNN
jgi:RNA polymerase sigma factor (sigma-70 family)